ncbi:hypothetical protein Bca4012_063893 [Brassica carinata]
MRVASLFDSPVVSIFLSHSVSTWAGQTWVQPILEQDQRMDQPYDVLGPRQGTSDFHRLPYRQAASVVSTVCGKYSNFYLYF